MRPPLPFTLSVALVLFGTSFLAGCTGPQNGGVTHTNSGAPGAASTIIEVDRSQNGAAGNTLKTSMQRDGRTLFAAMDNPSAGTIHLATLNGSWQMEVIRPITSPNNLVVAGFHGRPYLAFRNSNNNEIHIMYRDGSSWNERTYGAEASAGHAIFGFPSLVSSAKEFVLSYPVLMDEGKSYIQLIRLTNGVPPSLQMAERTQISSGPLPTLSDAMALHGKIIGVAFAGLDGVSYSEGSWANLSKSQPQKIFQDPVSAMPPRSAVLSLDFDASGLANLAITEIPLVSETAQVPPSPANLYLMKAPTWQVTDSQLHSIPGTVVGKLDGIFFTAANKFYAWSGTGNPQLVLDANGCSAITLASGSSTGEAAVTYTDANATSYHVRYIPDVRAQLSPPCEPG